MGADVSRCPTPGQLEGLLAEQLRGPDRDAVEAHVEHCSSCQDRLDRLVGRPPTPSASRTDERPEAATVEPGEEFLARLRRWPPSGGGPAASAGGPLGTGRLGQYEVLGTLGRGGMGAVYKARHVELGKVVALKVLPAERVSEANVARFRHEVRAMGRLEHPNVVAAYDAGEHHGVRYLVMAFVDGIDLARLVEGRGPLPVADACELARQAAAGLQHAFERGLVHRDVKPQNLMLARDGAVKVLDLGLARSFADAAAEPLTATGLLLGTVDYLAPEQWDSPRDADTRADIYGLGCTLYHLVAGRAPFADGAYKTVLAKMWAHQQVPPPPVTGPRPDAPAGLAAVLDRMLAKKPADRFASPAEVAEVLRPFAAGADPARLFGGGATADLPTAEPAAATPGPTTRKTAPAGGRRRVVAATAAGIGLLILAGVLLRPGWRGPPGADAKPLAITEMRGTHYRDGNKLGDLRTSAQAVRVNDGVAVAAELTAPAYYYLIAFNPAGSKAGTEQLCLPDDAAGEGAPAARPEPRAEVRYPRDDGLFTVDAAGLQVFVLAAATKPLPPYTEWTKRRSAAGEIPWTGRGDGGTWRWHFDGREFTRLSPSRGTVAGAPPTLRELCNWFKSRPEFEAVQVFALPVTDDRK